MLNKEEAVRILLENKNYYNIINVSILGNLIYIKGRTYNDDILFEVSTESDYFDNDKSFIENIEERIEDELEKTKEFIRRYSTPPALSNLRERANKQLLNYMEDGIKNHFVDSIKIIHSFNFPRASGKTSAILYLADKYDLPVLFNTREMEKIVNRDFSNIQTYNIFDLNKIPFGTILVDEVQTKYIDMLKHNNRKIIGLVK